VTARRAGFVVAETRIFFFLLMPAAMRHASAAADAPSYIDAFAAGRPVSLATSDWNS
jgi:hypothetical protein